MDINDFLKTKVVSVISSLVGATCSLEQQFWFSLARTPSIYIVVCLTPIVLGAVLTTVVQKALGPQTCYWRVGKLRSVAELATMTATQLPQVNLDDIPELMFLDQPMHCGVYWHL